MKLYFSKGACSLVVRIILNELGLACDYIAVNLKDKKTEYNEDFLAVNPKGSVPTFVNDNGDVITENAVILQYLADFDHDGLLLAPVRELLRYRTLEKLNFITTELHKGFGPLFNPNIPDQLKTDIFIPNLMKKFAYLNSELKNKEFLMGADFTLPDAYLFVMIKWGLGRGFDFSQCPELTRYYQHLENRKSIQQSILQESGD